MSKHTCATKTCTCDPSENWPGLKEWLEGSLHDRLEIARRTEAEPCYDPFEDLNLWENDREVLLFAYRTTPATNLHELKLKARLARFPFTSLASHAEDTAPDAKLMESIFTDLVAMEEHDELGDEPAPAASGD